MIDIEPQRCCLVIADYYVNAVDRVPHATSRDCIAKVSALRASLSARGAFVCYTATAFRTGFPEISARNKLFSERLQSGQLRTYDAAKVIHAGVRGGEDDVLVSKRRVSALHGTDLDILLKAHDIRTLIICGYSSSGVVLSTVRQAADMDYEILLVEDCCIDNVPEVHDFLFQKIFPTQATIVTAADLL